MLDTMLHTMNSGVSGPQCLDLAGFMLACQQLDELLLMIWACLGLYDEDFLFPDT